MLGSTSSSGKTSVLSVRWLPSERIAARYSFWRMTKRPMPTRPDPAIASASRAYGLAFLSGRTRYDESNIIGLTSASGHERLEVDLLRLGRLQRRQVVVGDDDVAAAAEVVALDDVLRRHLVAAVLVDLAVADPRHVAVVELVERDALLANGGHEPDRDGDHAERDRARPHWTRHGVKSTRVRSPAPVFVCHTGRQSRAAPAPGRRGRRTDRRRSPAA